MNNQTRLLLTSKKDVEWYTPPEYILMVKSVLGCIDLDPASSESANLIVGAKQIFTLQENGLNQEWAAKTVFINPPYNGEATKWMDKLFIEKDKYGFSAIALIFSKFGYKWFEGLVDKSTSVCLVRDRICFLNSTICSGLG